MIHAREDYQRFQDPANDKLITEAIGALAFARSAIKCDEDWTETCETVIGGVIEKLSARATVGEGSTPIAEDEPVILFRAQDIYFENILRAYLDCIELDPKVQPGMVDAVYEQIKRAREWQDSHKPKSPDLPESAETAHFQKLIGEAEASHA